jgi:hypothetical protein
MFENIVHKSSSAVIQRVKNAVPSNEPALAGACPYWILRGSFRIVRIVFYGEMCCVWCERCQLCAASVEGIAPRLSSVRLVAAEPAGATRTLGGGVFADFLAVLHHGVVPALAVAVQVEFESKL